MDITDFLYPSTLREQEIDQDSHVGISALTLFGSNNILISSEIQNYYLDDQLLLMVEFPDNFKK